MPTEHPPGLKFEIGHVLFIDIVGYSKLLINEQSGLLETLKTIVRGTEQFRSAEAARNLLRLPTGDGVALVFRTSPEAPVLCALEIAKALKDHPDFPIRMGIHSGPVNEVIDLNEQANVAGAGINIAQRVMDCGDAGHILLSRHVAEDLEHHPRWRPYLHPLGECEVKHGAVISVVNFYQDELGNPTVPQKFAIKMDVGAKTRLPASAAVCLRRWAIGILVGTAIVICVLAFLRHRKEPVQSVLNQTSNTSTAAAIPEKSIAVLPFVNMSANKADEYLSDGMTEELLNVLTKVKQLRVPGRSSSFAFKGKNEDDIFRKVGKQLHVSAVLEGSVRKAGDKLRITAQLIKVADGFHVWSESYDGDMKDILAFQSDVAKKVVEALELQLGVDEKRALAKRATDNPEAHQLYLRGRYNFAKFTQEGWTNAIRDFEQALRLDPGYALAVCGLADVYGWGGGQVMSGRESWAKQMELAQRALVIDPELAEAHLSMGTALQTSLRFKASEKELDRAVELNPNIALIYDQRGWTFACLGRFDEALANAKKALELDPLNSLLNTDLAWFFYLARRNDEATAQIRNTLELDPNNAFAHSILGWCLFWKGKTAEARAEFQKATALDDLPWYRSSFAYTTSALGNRAQAAQILRELQDLSRQRYVSPSNLATVYLGLGETEKALDWLDKAFVDQDPVLWWLASDQLYDNVRNEPRFQALLQKIRDREAATKK